MNDNIIILCRSFFFFFVVFSFLFGSCILILLIFRNKIIHISFCFCELHFVHSFSGIPMKESLSSKHSSKLFSYSFEHLLDGSRISDKCDGHFKTFWRNITYSCFNIVWNPLNEVWWIFVLNVEHLFVYLFRRHSTSEHGTSSKISSMSWIRSAHHIFSIKHLLSEFWYCNGSIYLRSSWG